MKKTILSMLIIFCLFLISSCGNKEEPIVPNYDNQINAINSQLGSIEERIALLEANQLSAEDIRTLVDMKAQDETSNYRDSELPQGCPDDEDLNKWFEIYSRGDISWSQYRKIQNRYNDCH